MERAISNIESRTRTNFTIKPYFATEFKLLYRKFQLACVNSATIPQRFLNILRLLGDFDTKLQFPINKSLTSSPILNNITLYFVDSEFVLDKIFGQRWLTSILHKMYAFIKH